MSNNSDDTKAGERIDLLRIVDANANRASEGLRAVEEFARFVLDDRHLTRLCKELRHELTALLSEIWDEARRSARQTQSDVGTQVTAEREYCRENVQSVMTANFHRAVQSLRCLEEYCKPLDATAAKQIEALRYRAYTLQQAMEVTAVSIERLADAKLYVLLDGCSSPQELQQTAQNLILGGADVLQLRDKRLDDRSLLERARLLRQVTKESSALLIVNDRPDVALLAAADGVHVGQDELSVRDVRRVVGSRMLVGVSTHSLEQAQQAVLDGADYIGVGPTFPSQTKQFDDFPGIDLLQQVAGEIRLPAFAIGGITAENLPQVLDAGLRRVAVGAAITGENDPGTAARGLKEMLSVGKRRASPASK